MDKIILHAQSLLGVLGVGFLHACRSSSSVVSGAWTNTAHKGKSFMQYMYRQQLTLCEVRSGQHYQQMQRCSQVWY